MFKGAFLFTLSNLFIFASAQAAKQNEAMDFTIHQHYVSPRALGMGNAFTAVADDYSAMFYNPAGLPRIESNTINLGIGAMIDKDVIKLKNDIETASKSSGSTQINDIATLLASNYGKHYSMRLPTTGAFWVHKNWGIAILPTDLSLELEIHNMATPTLDVIATNDTTVAFSVAKDLKWLGEDKLSVGFTTKGIYRGHVNRSLLALDLALDSTLFKPEDANEGLTVDGDLGFMYSPIITKQSWLSFMRFLKPTYGFTIRNIADYGFTTNLHYIDKNTGTPPKLQRRYDLKTKWELTFGFSRPALHLMLEIWVIQIGPREKEFTPDLSFSGKCSHGGEADGEPVLTRAIGQLASLENLPFSS